MKKVKQVKAPPKNSTRLIWKTIEEASPNHEICQRGLIRTVQPFKILEGSNGIYTMLSSEGKVVSIPVGPIMHKYFPEEAKHLFPDDAVPNAPTMRKEFLEQYKSLGWVHILDSEYYIHTSGLVVSVKSHHVRILAVYVKNNLSKTPWVQLHLDGVRRRPAVRTLMNQYHPEISYNEDYLMEIAPKVKVDVNP